jgi:hypothetical protein
MAGRGRGEEKEERKKKKRRRRADGKINNSWTVLPSSFRNRINILQISTNRH